MARSTPRPPESVTWRDGVHLTGTPIWCDARRRRDVCFVSAADRLPRGQSHGQLIGTPITLALVGGRDAAGLTGGHLAVPVRRPFTLGTLRLELIPSGRGLGAAALHVEGRGRTWLYAGPVRTSGSRDAAEVRASDAVVVAAPFGERHHTFAAVDEVAAQVLAWVRAELAAGRVPVLAVDSVLDGLEVAARLAAEGIALAGSTTLRDAAKRLAKLEPIPAIRTPGKKPAALVRVEGDRLELPAKAAVALVAGRAIEVASTTEYAGLFAWPFAAGRKQLLAWIEQTKAREVFVTGTCAETIVQAIGKRARVLGPPHQMSLFEAVR